MSIYTQRRNSLGYFVTFLFIAVVLAGCRINESGKALTKPSPVSVLIPTLRLTSTPSVQPTIEPTVQATPTPFILGPDYDLNLDLKAGPVEVPFEIRIPSLKVKAPVLAVGLINGNIMDAPIGPVGDPVWQTAFWYRGGGIPGESGTATIGGHVSNLLGEREIFGYIRNLRPGDLIIIHENNSSIDVFFYVDKVKVYSEEEASYPAVLAHIFGEGPPKGIGPQPASDGLSHLTLITCGGEFVDGKFNSHTVVYATRGLEKNLLWPDFFPLNN